MSVAQPLLDTIEPDEPLESSVNTKRPATAPVVLTPTNATQIQNDPEAGQSPVNRINPLTTNFLSQALWGYFDRYILISTTFHNFTAFILVGPSHGSLLLIPVPRSSYNRLYSMWMVYRQLCSFGTHPPPSLPNLLPPSNPHHTPKTQHAKKNSTNRRQDRRERSADTRIRAGYQQVTGVGAAS